MCVDEAWCDCFSIQIDKRGGWFGKPLYFSIFAYPNDMTIGYGNSLGDTEFFIHSDNFTARQLGQDEDAAVSGLLDEPRRVSFEMIYAF